MSAIDEIRPGRCPLGLRAPAGFPGVLPAECGRLEAGAPLSFTGHAVLLLHLCGGRASALLGEESLRLEPGCFLVTRDASALRLLPEGKADCAYLLLKNARELAALLARDGALLRPHAGCRAAGLLWNFCRRAQTGGFQNPFAASEAAYRILMELCAAAPRADACSELVQGAIDLIRSEPAFLAGVDELAEKLGVSKSHLIRTFTAEVRESPGKFLQRERIDAAKLLLLNREYPVETVANMTGYAGANYFCKVFRRLTGESPGEYRARASAPLPGRDLPRLDAFEGVHYV